MKRALVYRKQLLSVINESNGVIRARRSPVYRVTSRVYAAHARERYAERVFSIGILKFRFVDGERKRGIRRHSVDFAYCGNGNVYRALVYSKERFAVIGEGHRIVY